MEWSFEDSVAAPARWQCLVGVGRVLQEVVYAPNQCPIYGPFSPPASTRGSRNQGVEMGLAPLTITLSD